MRFNAKAALAFAAFLAGLLLAIEASRGTIDARLAIVGVVACVIIEAMVFTGPMLWGGRASPRRVTGDEPG